jgi:hypothetical protein
LCVYHALDAPKHIALFSLHKLLLRALQCLPQCTTWLTMPPHKQNIDWPITDAVLLLRRHFATIERLLESYVEARLNKRMAPEINCIAFPENGCNNKLFPLAFGNHNGLPSGKFIY